MMPEPRLDERVGTPVDVAPFGEATHWNDDGTDYGVFWEDARDLFRLVVTFLDATTPIPRGLRLEYWRSSWPHTRIPRDKPSGAGRSGWLNVGDWFQGEWTPADAALTVADRTCTFTFRPISEKEFPDLGDFDAAYRTTLKLRLVADAPLPEVAAFRAYTDSVWRTLDVEIAWSGAADHEQVWNGRLDVFNGHLGDVTALADGIKAELLYAETPACNSFDETIVTVRAAHDTFSFAVADLLKWGHILIPDYGVLVRRAGVDMSYAQAERCRRSAGVKSIYTRVLDEDEQTLTRAWADTPVKGHHLVPLGFEGGRQHFGLDEHGDLFCVAQFHRRVPDAITPRCDWLGDKIIYSFGLADARFVERTLDDGCLPIVTTTFERDGVRTVQTAFVVPLDGVPRPGARIRAEDILVCMLRFEMTLTRADAATAHLNISVSDSVAPDGTSARKRALAVDGDWIVDTTADMPRRRMRVASPDASSTLTLNAQDGRIGYKAELTSGCPTRVLDVAIPYVPLASEQELLQMEALAFDETRQPVRDYWRARVASGAQITTPEPMINDFYKAHVPHMLLTTEREPGDSERAMARVSCFYYGAFGNESCMVIADLDRRGYHVEAERALETFLHYQGTVGLPGDYSTTAGQLYGAGGYEHGGYNQHHGWILWCLAEHSRFTHDEAWLRRAAPHMIEACDWIARERARTREVADRSPVRAIERGLLPPGSLEDIGDWRSWLVNNVYSWWGLLHAADVLAEASHPESQRLLDEAAAYRRDIIEAFTEAMRRSPVVRLRDGRWVPHVPSEVHRRGRSYGWIPETLEGAICLVITGLLDPFDRRSTWILDDFEDNLCLSEQYGYSLTGEAFERRWFSHGGVSQQANLLRNPIAYLARDEVKHFLRAAFNAFAVTYFPDTRMMTEHALPEIGDWFGDHYKSSDEANAASYVRLMFVMERGDDLWLGAAIPRYWLVDGRRIGIENAATHFGPMSVVLESRAATGEIEMRIDPPRRNPPRVVHARFRHPEKKRLVRCTVDGKPCNRFDADKEWVILYPPTRPTTVVAYYE